MLIPRFYHPDTVAEVMALLLKRMPAGLPVTAKDIATAREIIWCQHAVETIDWKQKHLTIQA